jgi:signal peptide peptidase SppA
VRTFRLDADAIATAGASPILALDIRAIGQSFSLAADSPMPRGVRAIASGVAEVVVVGPLTQRAESYMCGYSDGYDAIEARFKSALGHPDVTAVVLRIDSPGGDAAGCFEAVRRMRDAAASSGKPVIAYADELAASAAYALACVANEIYLPASGVVGSVGVLSVHEDISKALDDQGVKITILRSGAKKATLNPFEPLSDEARAEVQGAVNELAGQFAELVAGSRGMGAKDVLALEAGTFMGQEAVKARLANGIKSWDAVVRLAEQQGRKAQKTRRDKAMRDAAIRIYGLSADATDAQIETAMQGASDAVAATGKKTGAEAVGAITAWKDDSASLATERAQRVTLEQSAEAVEAKRLIDVAASDRKVVPANRAKVEALYKKHGMATLQSHLDALVPVMPAALEHGEQNHETGSPAADEKKFSAATPAERHDYRATHGDVAYAAWKSRG